MPAQADIQITAQDFLGSRLRGKDACYETVNKVRVKMVKVEGKKSPLKPSLQKKE
jgi:hypothetical protein